MDGKVKKALDLIDEAVQRYKPVAIYGLFSGGHDSTTATHIAAQYPGFTAAAHINTGIGIEMTRCFVRRTCEEQGWMLKEYWAKKLGHDYRDIVLKHGFPGPRAHRFMYILLKERGVRALVREAKKERMDKVLLVTGVRVEESVRRMGNMSEIIKKEEAKIWVSPIHDWTTADTNDYIAENKIPRNPVVDMIHKSGECLCGAYAQPGELKELAFWFPEVAAQIRQLEAEVRAAGHNWGWEDIPPHTKGLKEKKKPGPLCNNCVLQRPT